MTERGISRTRMTVAGYGEADPVASNSTASGRQQNRRVEFLILNRGDTGNRSGGTSSQHGSSAATAGSANNPAGPATP